MANWQALTFGGFDPIGTEGQSRMSFAWNGKDLRRNVRYQKRLIRFQNEQSKAMSLWSAKEMPSATMQGLKSAGLNPLLAAGGSTNVAPTVASSAATVPSNQSFVDGGSDTSFGDLDTFKSLFSDEPKTAKSVNQSTRAKAEAEEAESNVRADWFRSEEGKKAVREKLRMDYAPQNPMQLAVHGAHSAKDSISWDGVKDLARELSYFLRDRVDDARKWWNRNPPSVNRDSRQYHIHYHGGDNPRGPVWAPVDDFKGSFR